MKPRIIYDNFWRKGTILTPSSEEPQHPATDTQIDTMSMYWKASSKTSPVTLPVNLGSAKEIDFVAILAHNIESSGVVITFEGDDVDTFDSGGFVTRTLTYNVTNIFEFITAFTKQYVRLKLVKAAGDFTDYPQVATIICGKHFELNRSIGPGYEEGSEDFSELEYSDSQIIFSQEKEIIDVKSLPFRGLTDATREEILLFFKEVGIHKAFVICFDSSNPNSESHWVINTEIVNPSYQKDDCWTWQLNIREFL